MKEKTIHMVKGFAAFAAIYLLAAVLVEIVLILDLTALGYDGLHGEMPDSFWVGLFPLYGFAAFALLCIVFNCAIRKKKLADMQMHFGAKTFAALGGGMAAGAVLVAFAIGFLTVIGAYQFKGTSPVGGGILVATFGAYFVQGVSEEIMCRGFLQNYFEEKLSRLVAILLSAVAFAAPHIPTVADYGAAVMALSLVNLLLVSLLFSFVMVRFKSLWAAAGIHVGWNFVLSAICGLELSGGESAGGILRFSATSALDWLHGGAYGIEAGIVVTVILIVCDIVLYRWMKPPAKA